MKHSELRHQPRHVNPRIQVLNKRVVRAYYLLDDDYNSISYDLFLALAG